MRHRYEIVPAEPWHVAHVAEHMREADRQEVLASSGLAHDVALQMSVEASDECFAGLVDDVPICIFGVAARSLLSETAVPWLLGTPDIESHAKPFLVQSRTVVRAWRSRYELLENRVDARNTKSIQWLRWLGFTIHDPEPHGPFDLPFHHFTMRSAHV